MCQGLYVEKHWFQNQGEISDFFGEDNVIFLNTEGIAKNRNYCLCTVDLERTAEKTGYIVSQDCMDVFFTKPEERFVIVCQSCGEQIGVTEAEKDAHSEVCEEKDKNSKYVAYSGPILIKSL